MTQTFDEWYKEVLAIVKANHPIYLIGGPDPNDPPEEPIPLSDEQVARWDEENRFYFEKYYKDGETPQWAIVEFVAG